MAALKSESILWFTREATVLISVMCVIDQVWFVSECDFSGFLVCFFEQIWKQVLGMSSGTFVDTVRIASQSCGSWRAG